MKLYICLLCLVAVESYFDGELKMVRLSVVTTAWADNLQLYTQLTNVSTVSSPTIVHMCMTNVVLGAYNETLTEMSNVLQLPRFTGGDLKPHESYSNIDEEYKKLNKSLSKILYGNCIWVNSRIPIVPMFLSKTATYFPETKVAYYNTTNLTLSEQEINDYIKNKTAGHIEKIIPPGSITDTTDIVLASALSTDLIWNQPFLPIDVIKTTFHKPGNLTSQVDMMYDDYRLMNHTVAFNATVGEVTCWGNRFAIYFFLPFPNNTLENLEKTLAIGNNSKEVFARMKQGVVYTGIPKFKFESTYELSKPLQQMGMVKAFDPKLADFYRLSRIGKFSLTKYYHKAVIEVNENGTVPIPGAPYVRHRGTIEANLTLDRPFIFAIRDTIRGITILQGKYLGV